MLKSLLKAQAARRGARFMPGGWITMAALSPQGRRAIGRGAQELQKQYRKRRHPAAADPTTEQPPPGPTGR
jgi:hypothetical protein